MNKYGARKTPCQHGHTHDSGGIKVPRAVKHGSATAVLPWPPIKEYIELFYSEGRTTAQIAALYGCSPTTLRQHRRRLGVLLEREDIKARLAKHSRAAKSGCIEWTGARMPAGYGVISCTLPNHHRTAKAHRIAWEIANNASLLPGAVIMHECDNPCCVNPKHLTLGTHLENMAQAKSRGRMKPLRGEDSERSLLTAAIVLEARKGFDAGVSIPRLARKFGVKYPAMYNAVRGRTWSWLK